MTEEPPADAFKRYLAEQERADPDLTRRLGRATEEGRRLWTYREPTWLRWVMGGLLAVIAGVGWAIGRTRGTW